MNDKMIRRFLGLAGAVLMCASLSSASTITYYVDVFGSGLATTTLPASTTIVGPGTSVNLNLPQLNQFGANAAIGETAPPSFYYFALTAVTLTLNWEANGTVVVYNLSCFLSTCQDLNFTGAQSSVPVTLTAVSGAISVTAPGTAGPVSGTALYGFGPHSGGDGGFTNSYPGETGSGSAVCSSGVGAACIPNADLGSFEGNGVLTVTASVNTGSQTATGTQTAGPPNNLSWSGVSSSGAILEVQYTYNQLVIPEPVTMALVGASLLGLGVMVRRRTRRAKA